MKNAKKIIKELTTKELDSLKKNLNVHFNGDINLKEKKLFLSSHVPQEIISSSERLLDSTLNELMKMAAKELEGCDTSIKNKFYEYDFRSKVKEWTKKTESMLLLEEEYVKYSTNPQMKDGLISSGVIFILGAAIIKFGFLPNMMVAAIVTGIVTVILSALTFKYKYEKAKPKAIEVMKKDIYNFIDDNKNSTIEWLIEVINHFEKEFNQFNIENGIK